jgi:hypothetical protein
MSLIKKEAGTSEMSVNFYQTTKKTQKTATLKRSQVLFFLKDIPKAQKTRPA